MKRYEQLSFGKQFLHKWINIKADHKKRFGSAYGDAKVDQIYRYITIK